MQTRRRRLALRNSQRNSLIRAIKYNPKMMQYASYDLCDELSFITKAYKANPLSILYLPRDSYDRYPMLKILAQNIRRIYV